MSDPAPKDWVEAVPAILFGIYGFAFGFEAVTAMNEGRWDNCQVSSLKM
jgi:hypothetical protein